MTEEDFRWLSVASRQLCVGDSISPEDLLAEALARFISGQRRWLSDLPLRVQVRSAMRSIIHAWRKARKLNPEVSLDALMEQADSDDAPFELPAELPPEREAHIAKVIAAVNVAFAGDQVALDILEGLLEGLTPSEIQELLEITPTTYASSRTRIRRRLAKMRISGEFHD